MKTALSVLIALPVILGVTHVYRDGFSLDRETWGYAERLALVLFLLYLFLVISLGKYELYNLQEWGRQRSKSSIFFVLPSLAFGLAMFPRAAAFLSPFRYQLEDLGLEKVMAIWGWVYIVCLFFIVIF